ncbi:hypothetical protein COR50_19380 [Chitinophaga caeni]|uniref:Lipoprotein n=1 Tax=Chitinophaga caeni TaxID=2029983 RepID=A0A291QZ53_9BACT|nr:hypothetical protein [Chitinophaga caeni]ATL49162.1 hypothetical protein COR50_19380 [Chitinophaga caeni]
MKHRFNTGFRKTLIIFLLPLLAACNLRPSADVYFGKTVLNSNLVADFGSEQYANTLYSYTVSYPGVDSKPKTGEEATDMVKTKIASLEKALNDIKKLPKDTETTALIETAQQLFEFVLPVYKNEYTNFAKQCDEKYPADERAAYAQQIANQYNKKFEKLYAQLISEGKKYAQAHDLKVKWAL